MKNEKNGFTFPLAAASLALLPVVVVLAYAAAAAETYAVAVAQLRQVDTSSYSGAGRLETEAAVKLGKLGETAARTAALVSYARALAAARETQHNMLSRLPG